MLERQDQLGSPLLLIQIAPDGDISLRTKALGLIKLGSNQQLLDRQLNTIALLSSSLPDNLRGQTSNAIDLSDPSKPELQLKPEPKAAEEAKTSKP